MCLIIIKFTLRLFIIYKIVANEAKRYYALVRQRSMDYIEHNKFGCGIKN